MRLHHRHQHRSHRMQGGDYRGKTAYFVNIEEKLHIFEGERVDNTIYFRIFAKKY